MPNKRNLKDYGFLVLKGMGMGAADVVPGVSGGTGRTLKNVRFRSSYYGFYLPISAPLC